MEKKFFYIQHLAIMYTSLKIVADEILLKLAILYFMWRDDDIHVFKLWFLILKNL